MFEKETRGNGLRCLELFAGAGGLALASERAGLTPAAMFERDETACQTLRFNFPPLSDEKASRVIQADLKKIRVSDLGTGYDMLIGGPPCQPFSRGGQGKGHQDERDLFPRFVHFLHDLRPKAFLIENVAGLLNKRFSEYFGRIISWLSFASLSHPPLMSFDDGQPIFKSSLIPDYRVFFKILNAADYGVPQNRLRLFVIGIRSDLDLDWRWPEMTHSRDALLKVKFKSGEYFDQHDLKRKRYPGRLADLLKRLESSPRSRLLPHHTVRDAIGDLPPPKLQDLETVAQHLLIPGARSYPGHTGSVWDEPSKTLKAGVHGCPGGENMLQLGRGRVRYFTVRELARLQCFPDFYYFHGTRNQCVRQIGNAVPVRLGVQVLSRFAALLSSSVRTRGERVPIAASTCHF